jgi:hypothetical protein
MSDISIIKVKLIKKESLDISYTESDSTEVAESHKTPVHQDLKNALQALAPHLACIVEYIGKTSILNKELVENFTVTGYSIGGDEDDRGVVITGYRTLKSGKTVTLNTPFTRFEELPETAYYFISDVREKIDAIETEVLAYLDGSKIGATQPQLPFPKENKTTNAQIAEPENNGTADNGNGDDGVSLEKPKTKRGRKKKDEVTIITEDVNFD